MDGASEKTKGNVPDVNVSPQLEKQVPQHKMDATSEKTQVSVPHESISPLLEKQVPQHKVDATSEKTQVNVPHESQHKLDASSEKTQVHGPHGRTSHLLDKQMMEEFSGTADPLAELRRERGERRRYLGAMLDDADFLEGVLRRAHKCPLMVSDQKLSALAREGLQLACEAHKTLEARRVVPDPSYVGQIFTEEMVERQKHRRVTDVGRAAKILERLAEANEAADMRMVLRHADRLWEFLVGRPAPLVGARERVRQLSEASRIVATARLRGLRPPDSASPAALEVRACRLLGAPLPRDYQPPPQTKRRAKPLDLIDHKKVIMKRDTWLPTTRCPALQAWLLADVARARLSLHEFSRAAPRALRSYHAAVAAGAVPWQMLALVLQARALVFLRGREDARLALLEAATEAEVMGDQTLATFLRICETVVETGQFEMSQKQEPLHTRVRQLVHNEEQRRQVDLLFSHLQKLPGFKPM